MLMAVKADDDMKVARVAEYSTEFSHARQAWPAGGRRLSFTVELPVGGKQLSSSSSRAAHGNLRLSPSIGDRLRAFRLGGFITAQATAVATRPRQC